MNTIGSLRLGRARIAAGWCVGNFAQDMNGIPCLPDSPQAVRWCARGAVGSSFDSGLNTEAEEALYNALPSGFSEARIEGYGKGNAVAAFNNSGSREEVLALFDRAIANLSRVKATPPDWNAIASKRTVGDDVLSQEVAA